MKEDIALGNPAVDPAEDEFNRLPFSRAIAQRIASLGSMKGSAVIGLYGKWGYGKSTVLNFIKHYIREDYKDQAVVIEFNPWLFTDQKELVASFLDTLRAIRGGVLNSKKETAGDWLQRFSGVFGMIPIVGSGASKFSEQFGKELKGTLQEQQETLQKLAEKQPTVVVLIDDLDRLDRAEVMLMLKMVRLNANMPKLVYVLSFDDEIIAEVAGAAYGGGSDSGREFLEKIVQFPFAIPAIGHERLVNYVLQHARAACKAESLVLAEAEWDEFKTLNDKHFAVRLRTPRQAIRYGAALSFALPILRGEVDPLQQMVVEGVRLLFPALYKFLRDNAHAVTTPRLPKELDKLLQVNGLVDESETASSEDAAVRALVSYLANTYRNGKPIARAISNPRYFNRYFEYSITPDEIPEREFDKLRVALTKDAASVASVLVALAKINVDDLLVLLDAALPDVNVYERPLLARGMARSATAIIHGAGSGSDRTKQLVDLLARVLISPYVELGDKDEAVTYRCGERNALVSDLLASDLVLNLAPPLLEAMEFHNRDLDSDTRMNHETLVSLHKLVVGQIKQTMASLEADLYQAESEGFQLLQFWRSHDPDSFRAWFGERVNRDPHEARNLLDFFARTSIEFVLQQEPYRPASWLDSDSMLAALRRVYQDYRPKLEFDSPWLEVLDMYLNDPDRLGRTRTRA